MFFFFVLPLQKIMSRSRDYESYLRYEILGSTLKKRMKGNENVKKRMKVNLPKAERDRMPLLLYTDTKYAFLTPSMTLAMVIAEYMA